MTTPAYAFSTADLWAASDEDLDFIYLYKKTPINKDSMTLFVDASYKDDFIPVRRYLRYVDEIEMALDRPDFLPLPPIDSNSEKYFSVLKNAAAKLNLKELSMGMSSDFESAIMNGSTFLRLGTLIMGERNIT